MNNAVASNLSEPTSLSDGAKAPATPLEIEGAPGAFTKDFVFPITENLTCDAKEAAKIGEGFHRQYISGEPYHHICIDNFMNPVVLDRVLHEERSRHAAHETYVRDTEKFRNMYSPDMLPDYSRHLFQFFYSRPFIIFLEKLTGIKGLLTDPMWIGGGLHETMNGGHLNVHADFNYHTALKVERRLNLLIYMNRDWKSEYGGNFEIWDKQMTHCMHAYAPIFNRCVVFNTSSDSYHGAPQPINHPSGESRLAIGIYYYTATWDGTRRDHTTRYQVRPGSGDKIDWEILGMELVNNLVPPIITRATRKGLQKLRGKAK